MKTIKLLSAILSMLYTTGYSQISTSQIPAQQPVDLKASFLLKTNWDQWGTYAKYSPNKEVLGCWSTAMAQILYYHRLKPYGYVSYNCTKGYVINDSLSNHPLVWKNFTSEINKDSRPEQIETVARYSYLTALTVRKDFGTPKYLQMINPAPRISEHFDCKATFYASFSGTIPFSQEQMNAIAKKEQIEHIVDKEKVILLIKKEIRHKRPVYFHMGNFSTYGHSTVIDGYSKVKNTFYVHINYGSGGFRTGWYDLFKPIDVADDIRLRAFVTIEPVK